MGAARTKPAAVVVNERREITFLLRVLLLMSLSSLGKGRSVGIAVPLPYYWGWSMGTATSRQTERHDLSALWERVQPGNIGDAFTAQAVDRQAFAAGKNQVGISGNAFSPSRLIAEGKQLVWLLKKRIGLRDGCCRRMLTGRLPFGWLR